MKQTPTPAQSVNIQRKDEERRRKAEVLGQAKDYLRDLLAEADTKDAGQFLRFALTRAFCEYELPLIQELHRLNKKKTHPRPEIARVAEFSSKLVNALEAANAAYKQKSPGAGDLFPVDKIDQVVNLRDLSSRLLRQFWLKSTRGRALLEKRLYAVSALLPYLRWSKLTSRADAHEPADTGAWSWLTKWDDHFGKIHVLDQDWLSRRLCAGGLTPEDFDDRARFLVVLSNKPAKNETLLRWWTTNADNKNNQDTIIKASAAFIAWRLRLFKKAIYIGDVGSTASLSGIEADFAQSASKTLAHHTGLTQRFILNRWSEIHL
jgi:hypothetical protein